MAFRQAFFQLCVIIGCMTFAVTLWLGCRVPHSDPVDTSLRAVGAGVVIIVIALVIFKVIERFSNSA